MLKQDDTVMVLVDVQGKLAQLMYDREVLFGNIEKLIRAMHTLDVPIIWMEQIPETMGRTVPRLATLLEPLAPISKTAFSCCGESTFISALEAAGKKSVLLAGIETHVCVYQTSADLVRKGYQVEVVADAVSSRTEANKQIGLDKISAAGASRTSTETAIMELTRDASHPKFRDILKIIK